MPLERLAIPNSDGHLLDARLDVPETGQAHAFALFAHCFTCNKNYKAIRNISQQLCRTGIAVLRFDFTGLGASEGDFADTNFSSNVADLVAAADYLGSHYQAPQLLIGHSLGGAAVLQATQQIASTRTVVTINAPCEPGHITQHLGQAPALIATAGEAEVTIAGRQFTIKKQFLDDLQRTRMDQTIGNLGQPLLICHAPHDTIVGIDNASHIFTAARHPKSFLSLNQADHLLSDEADSRYVGSVIAAWVSRYLV